MKVELRKVVYSARMSEETACFVAKIYVDGVHMGDASNQGHGDGTLVTPFSLRRMLTQYGVTLPKIKVGTHCADYAHDAESVVDNLLYRHLLERDAARMLRSKRIVFSRAGSPNILETGTMSPETKVSWLSRPVDLHVKLSADKVYNLLPAGELVEALYARVTC